MWMAGISCFLYVGIEICIYGWLPSYWAKTFPADIIPASMTGIVFWMSLTAGRFFIGKVVDRLGFSRYLIAVSFLVMLFGVLWYLFPDRIFTLVISLLMGLAISGIFPTMIASGTSRFPRISGIISAFIGVFVALGGLFIPSGLGYFADIYGIKILPLSIMILNTALFIFIFLTWGLVIKKLKKF